MLFSAAAGDQCVRRDRDGPMSETAYLGELRLVDLLNQQRVLIDTQMSYLEVQRDSMLALVDLERAIGSAGLF